MTTTTLGVRSLPDSATPAQRAAAEASWTPAAPDQPCPCSGSCWHGRVCDECGGQTTHRERRACGLFTLTDWIDLHSCACESWWQETELPAMPWGEFLPKAGAEDSVGFRAYDGVRHVQLGTE